MDLAERMRGYGEYYELDKGIRDTVMWLREKGFDTTDSGDGVSKATEQPDMTFVMEYPHVAMKVDPAKMHAEADRLWDLLTDTGIDVFATSEVEEQEMPVVNVEATYFPASQSALILLTGVNDKMLWEAKAKKADEDKKPPC